MNHLDKNSLLNSSQHGFRKGLSCSSSLLTFLESVTAHIDNKSEVDTLYLDLAKAFDKVPHQRLLQKLIIIIIIIIIRFVKRQNVKRLPWRKLKAHGIQGQVCSWIEAWLSNRHQRVCLDGSYST